MDQQNNPVKKKATMYFAFNGAQRPEVKSKTTFEAIIAGERKATTRYPEDMGYRDWLTLKKGDTVQFFEDRDMTGRSIIAKLTRDPNPINFAKMSLSEQETWSKKEGWGIQYAKDKLKGNSRTAGVQIEYEPLELLQSKGNTIKNWTNEKKSEPQPEQKPTITIGIVGTAGRKDDEFELSAEKFNQMKTEAKKIIENEQKKGFNIVLTSGGAAYADHIAVQLALEDKNLKLKLHTPCEFNTSTKRYYDTGEFGSAKNPGGIANALHDKFSRKCGFNSKEQIATAITQGAQISISSGFWNRNTEIAKDAEILIALTFGEGAQIKPGGTEDTVKKFLAKQTGKSWHINCKTLQSFTPAQIVGQKLQLPTIQKQITNQQTTQQPNPQTIQRELGSRCGKMGENPINTIECFISTQEKSNTNGKSYTQLTLTPVQNQFKLEQQHGENIEKSTLRINDFKGNANTAKENEPTKIWLVEIQSNKYGWWELVSQIEPALKKTTEIQQENVQDIESQSKNKPYIR